MSDNDTQTSVVAGAKAKGPSIADILAAVSAVNTTVQAVHTMVAGVHETVQTAAAELGTPVAETPTPVPDGTPHGKIVDAIDRIEAVIAEACHASADVIAVVEHVAGLRDMVGSLFGVAPAAPTEGEA